MEEAAEEKKAHINKITHMCDIIRYHLSSCLCCRRTDADHLVWIYLHASEPRHQRKMNVFFTFSDTLLRWSSAIDFYKTYRSFLFLPWVLFHYSKVIWWACLSLKSPLRIHRKTYIKRKDQFCENTPHGGGCRHRLKTKGKKIAPRVRNLSISRS